MKKILVLILSIVMAMGLVGCGAPEEEQPEEQIDYEIAMVTDSSMIMDGGYSQAAWTAISAFGADEGISHKYYKAPEASQQAYKETIDNAVSKGAGVIIADGYSFEEVVYDAQRDYKDVKFILIDAEPVDGESGEMKIGENTAAVIFASEQAGYLAGYAAVADGKNQLGFMGDSRIPAVMNYGYGFIQGAEAAAEEKGVSVNVKYHYSTDEEEMSAVTKRTSDWYNSGTEAVFACGSKVEQSVIEAAELTDKKVIAFETDKSEMSDTVMTSAVKDIEAALTDILKQYSKDEFPGGTSIRYNAENAGISLAMENSRFDSFGKNQYKTALSKLADGSIVVKRYDSGDIDSLGLSNVSVTVE